MAFPTGELKCDKWSETGYKDVQPGVVFMQAVFVEASLLHDRQMIGPEDEWNKTYL